MWFRHTEKIGQMICGCILKRDTAKEACMMLDKICLIQARERERSFMCKKYVLWRMCVRKCAYVRVYAKYAEM